MNCPRCGAAVGEGRAYCSNPACGAAPATAGPAKEVKMEKSVSFRLTLDFVTLARLAAALIALLAAAWLYFFARP